MAPFPFPEKQADPEDYNSGDEYEGAQLGVADVAAREAAFEEQMKRRGFAIKRMIGDGNCLFRAVSQAVYGDTEMHDMVRSLCVDHMQKERAYFARYVTEDFDAYLERKRRHGVHGNNIEIHALSEMYCRPILVYCYSDVPINTFQPEGVEASAAPIYLSYHNGSHFNALIHLDGAVGVGLGLAGYDPAAEREAVLKRGLMLSELESVELQLLTATSQQAELDALQAELDLAAMAESRLEAPRAGSTASGLLLPPIALELVSAGFLEDAVVEALMLFGEDEEALVSFLTRAR